MATMDSTNKLAAPVRTAKLFNSGRCQAVRLPEEFRFEGTEVAIRRDEATGGVLLASSNTSETAQPEAVGLPERWNTLPSAKTDGEGLEDRQRRVRQSSWQDLFAVWDSLDASGDEEWERIQNPPVERDFF